MVDLAATGSAKGAVPVHFVTPDEISKPAKLPVDVVKWAKSNGFGGQSGKVLLVPGIDQKIASVLFGMSASDNPLSLGLLAKSLPSGNYSIDSSPVDKNLACLGWLLGAYQFDKYKKQEKTPPKLLWPKSADRASVSRQAEAAYLARDLINTPANDLDAEKLENAVRVLAKKHHARVTVIKGDKLLAQNFPMIHAVGRASSSAPRLVDLKWGKASNPRITLVGKGVVFDSGGLNIKPGNSMALMKKDMGGAANVIALASMIMDAKLPVRLRLLVPAVENAISGNAFRPGDILPSRKGLSVEIGNTDAEGRLILADALTLASEEKPELIIDMATLTGAARVALGPDLPPFYTESDNLAEELNQAAASQYDPLWRMPLWDPYQKMLNSQVANVNHISSGGFAGSITAALFLSRFVEAPDKWVHLDIFGWVPSAKPWAPVGGEAQGVRALFEVIKNRVL